MTPEQYDAWYYTARGRWIGETEFRLISALLEPEPGARILDVGCGTGYFTRSFANEGYEVTGMDPDPAMLAYARAHRAGNEAYILGDGRRLPFSDGEFDYCISITALCFIPEERLALGEMARVSGRGLALGLLNRCSLLYLQKGRHGGRGAYHGAKWHTPAQARALLETLPMTTRRVRTAIYMPSGGTLAPSVEAVTPRWVPLGGFIAAAARNKVRGRASRPGLDQALTRRGRISPRIVGTRAMVQAVSSTSADTPRGRRCKSA
jgi:ubiquinone/menaquinone biosynthesis C-methylase UbiE